MKKLISLLASALFACNSFAITPSPITTLNSTGSTAGQVIVSTGPWPAPPAWTTITLSGLGGLASANNLSDVASASTSRMNLGLGTAAVVNTGTSGSTIPLLSTTNTWTLGQAFTVRPTFNGNTPYDTGNLTIANYAPLANPTFSGTVSVPNQAAGNNTTAAASTAFVMGTLAAPPAIGNTTASAGSFTTLSATGLISPTSTVGIKGTIAADEAPAGSWAERPTPTNLSAVSLTTTAPANAASVALTAGDWSVQCNAQFLAAGTTVPSLYAVGINTTSATRPAYANEALFQATFPAGVAQQIPSPVARFKSGGSFTAYCVTQSSFTTSTMTVSGTISAWRNR